MTDCEKVIKGLECCQPPYDCHNCPYDWDNCFMKNQLHKDALSLLKEKDCNCCGIVFDVAYKAGKADAVVRCKDCVNRHDSINCRMYSEGMDTPDNWFCADAERRTE